MLVTGIMLVLHWTARTACPMYAVTGIPCPSCGSTRAVISVLRGDFTAALRWHPLVVLLPPLAVLLLYLWFAPVTPNAFRKLWNPLLIGVLVLYIAVYAARMVLWFPHTEPMIINESAYFPRIWKFFVP